jgi:NAD(P)-dependent dehydrogenase (short-subunit alcohol dehydrogenase family)
VVDLPTSAGEEVAERLGSSVQFVAADVTDPDAVGTALDAAIDTGRPLRLVVNCAGIGPPAKVVGRNGPFPLDQFRKTVEVNLIGTFNVIRLAAQRMVESPLEGEERGVIVCTASVAAFDGQIGQAAYSASKGGLVGMTLPIARDLAVVGIRISTIAPGLVDTPIYGSGEASEEFKGRLKRDVLFPERLGRADEFASLVAELVTNSYMNGATVRIDGAARLQPK